MAAKRVETTLAEISEDVSYGYTESASARKVGPRFLRITDIQNGVVNWDTVPYCPISEDNHAKYRLQRGDIVIARTGNSTGENFLYDGIEDAVFASYLIRFRINLREADPAFVWYNLRSERWLTFINGSKTGSAQAGANAKVLGQFRLSLPSLPEQRAIASALGSLDDKIELNRRMNKTLEVLTQSLFKSWFVDATQSGLPKGWRKGKVSDLAALSRDGLNPGEFPDETFDHYSLPAFDEARTPKPERGDTIMSNKFMVPPNCVMVSKLNPRIPRIWLPDLRGPNRAVCSTEFLVAMPEPGVSREFLYCLFINETFSGVFTTMVTGTSGSHQRVRPESLLNMDTPLPPAPLIQKFTETVAPLLKRISQNIHESRTLAALRDALLPKLLSGELRVNTLVAPLASHL
jgi:type I restriction enzyme S subunit